MDMMNQHAGNSEDLAQQNSEILQRNLVAALTRLKHVANQQDFTVDAHESEKVSESFFSFVIGQYQFLIEATCLCEVFADAAVAVIPNAPQCVLGLFNLRGALIPVYQLHQSLDAPLPKKKCIFVVGKAEQAIGLLIDGLPVSLSLPLASRSELPDGSPVLFRQLAQAHYLHANKSCWFLEGKTLPANLLGLAQQSLASKHISAAAPDCVPV
ncbi:chemotaxis protein CheW [Cellvibrio sp.]|uniref:chemotaxis protein CheW n=1 Tax=Cellvibrio sp. TaxID=1965322 RepID=UPI0039647DCD